MGSISDKSKPGSNVGTFLFFFFVISWIHTRPWKPFLCMLSVLKTTCDLQHLPISLIQVWTVCYKLWGGRKQFKWAAKANLHFTCSTTTTSERSKNTFSWLPPHWPSKYLFFFCQIIGFYRVCETFYRPLSDAWQCKNSWQDFHWIKSWL